MEQVIDVFEEPPSPSGFGGGTKIPAVAGQAVVRKPIAEKESRLDGRDDNGNGKKKAPATA